MKKELAQAWKKTDALRFLFSKCTYVISFTSFITCVSHFRFQDKKYY